MKSIIELNRAITNANFYFSQFNDSGDNKNILFINPQLNGKQLYKTIIPYFSMYDTENYTAINDLCQYSETNHLIELGNLDISEDEILWSDFIVFPFTTQSLYSPLTEQNIYVDIKKINPHCKIVFSVDFNFFEMTESHPFFNIFSEEENYKSVLENIVFSDIIMVSNVEFQKYLSNRISNIIKESYEEYDLNPTISCIPILFDSEIILQNIDYDAMKPKLINKKINLKVSETAEKVKEENINNKKS